MITNIKRALISVFDKTGVVEFATALHREFGVELISTGGTARALQEAGLPVTLVEEVTGFPELMDGRVKTLHPKIHAAILADRDNPAHLRQLAEQGIEPIDMVVVNLYPFEQTVADPNCTFEQAIEMIDIGGPCLLRAAAKNHRGVVVVASSDAYADLLQELRTEGDVTRRTRVQLACTVFGETQGYDAAIGLFFMDANHQDLEVHAREMGITAEEAGGDEPPEILTDEIPCLYLKRLAELRYGENPHQTAAVFVEDEEITERPYVGPKVTGAVDAAETAMSFNNYTDASAALELCADLAQLRAPTACFIKHTNACGAAVGDQPLQTYEQAYLGDPNAAMGGILAVNFPVDATLATTVMETHQRFGKPLKEAGAAHAPGGFFVEVWIAPAFDREAIEIIRGHVAGAPQKAWGRRVRLLAVGDLTPPTATEEVDCRRIAGGLLLQQRDLRTLNADQWQVVSQRQPTEQEWTDLRLAWLVCKHTKSNAISLCRDGMLIGNGAGQMSRVMSCRIATWAAQENGHGERLAGAAAASDAFFPFRDGPDILAEAGVTAVIQPGGSKRDEEVIAAADERDLAMVFTGTRHFRH